MGANIELWKHRLYEDGSFFLEPVFGGSGGKARSNKCRAQASTPSAGRYGSAVAAQLPEGYSVEKHSQRMGQNARELAKQFLDFVLSIDESIQEVPRKNYIAYKLTRDFVCLMPQKNGLILYHKIDPSSVGLVEGFSRDVTSVGHHGTGDLELTIKEESDINKAKPFIEQAYKHIGG